MINILYLIKETMMSFLCLLSLTSAEWVVIYDGLYVQDFPISDLTGWVLKENCAGGGGATCSSITQTCNQNPNKYVRLDNNCERWQRTFTASFPYFKTKVVAALFFFDENDKQMKIDVQSSNVYTVTVSGSIANYGNNNCITTLANKHGQRTVAEESFQTVSNLQITFCYVGPANNKVVGIRHLTISLNKCHWSCKGCTAGDSSNQCTSCYFGTPSGGICPDCPGNTQFIDLDFTTCQQECERSKQFNSIKFCSTSNIISTLATELSSATFSSHSWTLIPDPQYYTLSVRNQITTCDTISYLGPIYNNEAIQASFTLSSGLVRYVRLRASFFLENWDQNTSIHIYINDHIRERLYQSEEQMLTLSSTKIFDQSSSCSRIVRMEFQFPTTTQILKIKFQGNMQINLQQQWGVRDVFIDQIVCAENCSACAKVSTCLICISTYYLYRGTCISQCPPFSTVSGFVCTDYEDGVQNSAYLVKALYDTTSTSETEAEGIMGTYTNQAGTNFVTGYRFGFLPNRRVFGGPFSWHKASFSRTFSSLAPHYGYRIIMTIYLGESAGTFSYQFTGLGTATITSDTAADSTANLWGKSNHERIYKVDLATTAVQGDIIIVVQYIGQTSPQDGFAAISDYYLILYKCMPFCNSCTSATTCITWTSPGATFFSVNPLLCSTARYLDTTTSPFTCPQCGSGCISCTSLTECSSCSSNFNLLEGICYCKDGLYLNGSICSPCHSECLTCNGNTAASCLSCSPSQFRILSKNTCICKQYLEQADETSICQPICGDLYVASGEECDDGNNIPFDGCHKCTYSCPLYCLFCIRGKCLSCMPGFSYYSALRACMPVCGDLVSVQVEQCDDANSQAQDNCYLCRFQCDIYCRTCNYGLCTDCISGFKLNYATRRCSPICGDSLIVHDEQCDDGNMDGTDGCWNCQYQCPFMCATCVLGQCIKCQNGYALTRNNACSGICGNLSVQVDEQCDDGNTSNQDGCNNCMWTCQQECTNCNQGVCQECNTSGWALNLASKRCHPVYGDGIVLVNFEQCDDDNIIPFDGCFIQLYSCSDFCSSCALGVCSKCSPGYQIDEFAYCTPICGDMIVSYPEQCDESYKSMSNMGCFQCMFNCHPKCELCSYGNCQQCARGYILTSQFQCASLCGDSSLAENEQCEDENLQPFDGCYQCEQSCQESCDECIRGLCYQCKADFQFNPITNLCESICGDLIISESEQCDDGNFESQDGCDSCFFACNSYCMLCSFGKCQACAFGYYLDDKNQCSPICGDEIIAGQEECDDGNLIQGDGCYGCKYSCQSECEECQQGECLICQQCFGYYLIDGKCQPYCGDNIIAGREQCEEGNEFQYNGCSQCKYICPEFCENCRADGSCLSCGSGYELNLTDGRCVPQCNHLITLLAQCHQNVEQNLFYGCSNVCTLTCQSSCLQCVKGLCYQCNESNGWYLDQITLTCKSTCGDKLVADQEECDEGIIIQDHGCFECQLRCQDDCRQCEYGICQECKHGYYLGENKLCSSICGDGVLAGLEVCEDQNDTLYDGCYECEFSCQPSCLLCSRGICYECELPGWELDSVIGVCMPICGDRLVLGYEQCDDGNLTPYDGCYECKLQCQLVCTRCLEAECHECNTTGWELIGIMCHEICGDGLIVGAEHCEDNNLVQHDGCFNCKFDCEKPCVWCNAGACMLCEVGWQINEYHCEAICGDSLVRGLEECDDGNEIPNDGCFQCQYSCDIKCLVCGAGNCLKCQAGWQIDPIGICQPICGDKLIQVGYESCDDGNNISGDGCHECEYSCHFACTSCQLGICMACITEGWQLMGGSCTNTCGDEILVGQEICDDGNLEPYDGCYDCDYSCHLACVKCQKGVCIRCAFGWYLQEQQCQTVCGDGIYVPPNESCDDGNNSPLDGCSQDCIVEQNGACSSKNLSMSSCIQSDYPKMLIWIEEIRYDFARLHLNFSAPMRLSDRFLHGNIDFSYILQARILSTLDYQYNITIEEINGPDITPSNVLYELRIQYKESIPRVVIEIQLLPNHLVSDIDQEIAVYSVKERLHPSKVLSEEERKQSIQAQEFTIVIISLMGGIAGLSILTGNLSIFQNILDQIQILSYIKFINLSFPENLEIFFDALNIVDLDPFLKKIGFQRLYFWLFVEDQSMCSSHGKFKEDNVSACFGWNSQSFLFCFITGYFGYFFSKLILASFEKLEIYQFNELNPLISRALLQIKLSMYQLREQFYFSGLITILQASYYDVAFAALMQLSNQSFESIHGSIQLMLAISVFTMQLLATVQIFYVIKKVIQQTSGLKKSNFIPLFDGLTNSLATFWNQQFNSLLLAKKLLFMLALIRLQETGITQSIIISFLSLFQVIFMVKQRPLVSRVDTFKQILYETTIAFTTITFVVYGLADELNIAYSEQLLLGWVHICAFGGTLTITFFIDVGQEAFRLYRKLKMTCKIQQTKSSAMEEANKTRNIY